MKKDGVHGVLVRGHNKKAQSQHIVHYVRRVTERLQNEVELCGKDDIIFCTERRDILRRVSSPSMAKRYS